MLQFNLVSKFKPTGDQPKAIDALVAYLKSGIRHETLLGATGSGKTFTMANIIMRMQKPALIISHNKTLAAQLYEEFREFFPENAVHYFVSYYDYYQPEAYIPRTDTYIEKDAKINEMIDALRHASTASLLTRRDTIIVASVSCIYGIGNPEEYEKMSLTLAVGERIKRTELLKTLSNLQYVRNALDPRQGHFRTRENRIEIHLPTGKEIIEIECEKDKIISLGSRKRETGASFTAPHETITIFPAKHFVTPHEKIELAVRDIEKELKMRLAELRRGQKILEAARLKQRTEFDIEMLLKTGYTNGIENYSRTLSFRDPGSPPATLIDYFTHPRDRENRDASQDFLTFIDESHVTIPQIRGMYNGDRARKQTLVDYGFRLPSALDNRPLTFEEFNKKIGQCVYVSATPSPYELRLSAPHIAEQLIRPTGILDPETEVRPTKDQMRDITQEIKKRVKKGERSLVMALTKRLAEDISEYLVGQGVKAEYLHSEIKTLDRPEVLRKLRTGDHDVIVGINLLREGLDLPEVSFIAILDADKEGFLRTEVTLLQIIGRAARHTEGKVVLYADTVTASMKKAMDETARRRKVQRAYNKAHRIVPQQIRKEVRKSTLEEKEAENNGFSQEKPSDTIMRALEREMKKAARELNFEHAAKIHTQLKKWSALTE